METDYHTKLAKLQPKFKPINNLAYYNTTAHPPTDSLWQQTRIKDYATESTREYNKKLKKAHEAVQESAEQQPSYTAPTYDKHCYFGIDYVTLCRFQMQHIANYSQFEKRPAIDLQSLRQFMTTYITETTLRTLDDKIHHSKEGFANINELVVRGLFNIALTHGEYKSTNEQIKKICRDPPYNLACMLINPDDQYHKHHPNGSQYVPYNKICEKTYYTQAAAKQELGEERGFFLMKMGETYYLISHDVCIKEMSPNAVIVGGEPEPNKLDYLSFDKIAAMYTGATNGRKIAKLRQSASYTTGVNSAYSASGVNSAYSASGVNSAYSASSSYSANATTEETEIVYNISWSKFYLAEITEEYAKSIMHNIVSFRTFVKAIRDDNCYINHAAMNPRQKLIFDIMTMFCDGLAVGFESKKIRSG